MNKKEIQDILFDLVGKYDPNTPEQEALNEAITIIETK